MELTEVMNELQELGTDQNVKIYKRHGVNNDLFGVSLANLKKIKRKIKKNHELAIELWDTDNYDARNLATYIADPDQITMELANNWIHSIDYYIASEMVSGLIAKSPVWRTAMDEWMKSPLEYVKSTAYYVFAHALTKNLEISDIEIEHQMDLIEKTIHSESNRVKHCMNNALIAIGISRAKYTQNALDLAVRLGKIEVDHGKTACKTPDAVNYIERALKRHKKK